MAFDRTFYVTYITPCEHREAEYVDPATGEKKAKVPICLLASEAVGFHAAIHPKTCAQCRLHGDVDPEHIRKISFGVLLSHLSFAHEGFHSPGKDVEKENQVVIGLFNRACEHALGDKNALEVVANWLKNCVKEGRLPYEDAKAIAEKHLKPLNPGA